jgi:hypothetical protein
VRRNERVPQEDTGLIPAPKLGEKYRTSVSVFIERIKAQQLSH